MTSQKLLLSLATALWLLAFNGNGALADDASDCKNISKDLSDDQVIAACSGAMQAGPASDVPSLFVQRAIAYKHKRDFEHALDDLTRALDMGIHPDNLESATYMARAAAFIGKGDIIRARDDFMMAVRLDPNSALAQKGLDAINAAISKH